MSESNDLNLDSFILVDDEINSSDLELDVHNENKSVNISPNDLINPSIINKRELEDYDFGSILVGKEKESVMNIINNENNKSSEYIEINNYIDYSSSPIVTEDVSNSFYKISDTSLVERSIKSHFNNDSEDEEINKAKLKNDNYWKKDLDSTNVRVNITNKADKVITREMEEGSDDSFEKTSNPEIIDNSELNDLDGELKLSEDKSSAHNPIENEIEINSDLERMNMERKPSDKTDEIEGLKTDAMDNIEIKIESNNLSTLLSLEKRSLRILSNDYAESIVKVDETDFRVNILTRDDSKDVWETNNYIQIENIEDKIGCTIRDCSMVRSTNEISNRETTNECDLKEYIESESILSDFKSIQNIKTDFSSDEGVDKTDFRVNVLMRDDSKDVWETNKYITNDDYENIDCNALGSVSSILKNSISNKEASEKLNLTNEIKCENKFESWKTLQDTTIPIDKNDINMENEVKIDERDTRENVLNRYDSENMWEMNDTSPGNIDVDRNVCNNLVLINENCNRERIEESDLTENLKSENEFRISESFLCMKLCTENDDSNNENDVKVDEIDFRVNVQNRYDSENIWETSQYIENDNTEKYIDNCSRSILTNQSDSVKVEENFIMNNDVELENKFPISEVSRNMKIVTEKNDINDESDIKVDEIDYRVNVLNRYDSEDIWETNQYIEKDRASNDHIIPESSNLIRNIEEKENCDLIENTELENNILISEPSHDIEIAFRRNEIEIERDEKLDEIDFRVNVLNRYDSEDIWETSQYIEKDRASNDHIPESSHLISNIDENENCDLIKDIESENNIQISEPSHDVKIAFRRNEIEIEREEKLDDTDYRVNVLNRYDKEDMWETNQYIEKDRASNDHIPESSNMIHNIDEIENCDLIKDMESVNNIQISEPSDDIEIAFRRNEIELERDEKLDEIDFRVNVLMRNDSKDMWETNQCIENDNNISENIDCNADNRISSIFTNMINNKETKIESDVKKEVESENEFHSIESLPDKKSDLLKNNNVESGRKINENIIKDSLIKDDRDLMKINQENIVDSRLICINGDKNCNNSSELKNITNADSNSTHIADQTPETQARAKQPIVIKKSEREHVKAKPLSTQSPVNFRSFNSIIYMLFNCAEFRTQIINYHHLDQIAYIDLDVRTDITVEDAVFVNNLCRLFAVMSVKEGNCIKKETEAVHQYFKYQSKQFDMYNGFNFILDKINLITKNENKKPNKANNEADISFFNFKSQNYGFVCDLFYGQISDKIFCKACQNVFQHKYEPINSISLKIRKSQTTLFLEICIKNYFTEHPHKMNERKKCCKKQNIYRHRQLTHAPEFLFIYVDHESTKDNHNYIESDNGVIIATNNEMVLYSIKCVLDTMHINKSLSLSKWLFDDWWAFDDTKIRMIKQFEVINQYSTGFLLKRQHDN